MVVINPFAVELWMDKYETAARYNLAETCAASISVDDLIGLSEQPEETRKGLLPTSTKLTYGAIRGNTNLRQNLARRYAVKSGGVTEDNILITNGAIAANFLVLYTLVNPGDHVICQYPTYEQLYQVPLSFGAEVSLWKMDPHNNWTLSIDELGGMIKDNTKLIIINNPNNPTGAIIPAQQMADMMELAKNKNITVMCDEVYRPLFHSISPADERFPSSAINMGYQKVVVTGSFSKAYSLAGIRTGWIATKDRELLEAIASTRHYTTISVSLLDQTIAAEAVSDRCIHALLGRNIILAQKNLELLSNFVNDHIYACSWVRPSAGTTAMIQFKKVGKPIDDEQFCKDVQEKTGVMLCPGSKCFGQDQDFRGYVRIGFVPDAHVLRDGLNALRGFMEEHYEDVPTFKKAT